MRATVAASDLLVYVSAALFWARQRPEERGDSAPTLNAAPDERLASLLLLLNLPLVLVDHGHFQYNAVMLGLTLWAVACFQRARFALGALLFCLALLFKQMALYFALPVFAHLLGIVLRAGE